MFLIADTTLVDPPTYLVSGDTAILLQDAQSIAMIQAVGIPLIQMSPDNLTDLTQNLLG